MMLRLHLLYRFVALQLARSVIRRDHILTGPIPSLLLALISGMACRWPEPGLGWLGWVVQALVSAPRKAQLTNHFVHEH
jgi:hypothetical protein